MKNRGNGRGGPVTSGGSGDFSAMWFGVNFREVSEQVTKVKEEQVIPEQI